MPEPWNNGLPTVTLAHAVYDLEGEIGRQGVRCHVGTARDRGAMLPLLGDTEILVVSGLWRNDIPNLAPRLRLVQSVSAGTDQYDRALLRHRSIRLASAQGANANAVSDHAMALLLALTRRIHLARDDQHHARWTGMVGDPALREQELDGKTMVIVGPGRIGMRLSRLARAFGMHVAGVRRDRSAPSDIPLHGPADLPMLAAEADVLALTCPLTPETEGLVSAAVIAAMKPGAILVNVARGRVVDEAALTASLQDGRISAGLDCFHDEPLPPDSPLWRLPNVVVTPHRGGETQFYERNVIALLRSNIAAMERGGALLNEVA